MPLYSESQAGYLHPLKYLLYPWMATWKAFNLDTVLSVWLTGLGTFGWLRRHAGPAGALTGAAVFGLSGFVWAHLIHTSMNNALTSVPFVVWALEWAWASGHWRGVALGALALACQVFAGHLQEAILTAGLVGLYGLYRAATERGVRARLAAPGRAVGLVALGMALAAVQWIPSKELLDRSPRAEGLTWDQMTYGSWHPELLPTLVVREAYGTRARDTDWMDGFYPYHEMNAYMGLIAMALAIVGGAAARDRWVGFWIVLAGVGGVLMLGRFTMLFDAAHRIPIVGSARIPVRFHLWVSLAVAALAGVGVDRLARPGPVRLGPALVIMAGLVLASLPILFYAYEPAWTESNRWTRPNHLARSTWLGRELTCAVIRTGSLASLGWAVAASAVRRANPGHRAGIAALLPVLVIADLLGAHLDDVPAITPRYWTDPPLSARKLKADPSVVRVFGECARSAGEPGYASEPVDFLSVRDALDWSLAPVWGLASSAGETPIVPRRLVEYYNHARAGGGRFDLESVTHLLTSLPFIPGRGPGEPAGTTYLYRNRGALPRARLMGRPLYVADERGAIAALDRLGPARRDRLVIEDPDRPLPERAEASGTAIITREGPERVEVVVEAGTDAYLILADTFDPGWSATLDGRSAPIRPAWVAFRAVYVPRGRHGVVFRYRPSGLDLGLAVSGFGLLPAIVLLAWPRRGIPLAPEHDRLTWPRRWPLALLAILVLIVLTSSATVETGHLVPHPRWAGSFHRFTWGAGIEAMRAKAAR
ncbi:MAG TPA: YfhO family protein [Isosphaeraceae bacterium]|nr:YfhO family protein [Isosphaeraceae bacterium]